MKYKSVKGMEDILPKDINTWRHIENRACDHLEFYSFKEIRTPVLETTSLFVRGIGEDTDIVNKEMYTLTDRKNRSLTMRPEGTAPLVRAYIEHTLPELKLYYFGPMFRSERPQKGRSRQFHQIGAEVLGASSYSTDAELIMQLDGMLRYIGLEKFIIKLNTLGTKEDKEKFAGKLRKYLSGKQDGLCEDCEQRIKHNVLRVLDCKKACCKKVVEQAPSIIENLGDVSAEHFTRLKACLKKMNINVEETKNLVRGLDYYTGTVFEITHPALGGQDAVGAGGRYDSLVKDLGGANIPAVGYALGIERMVIALRDEKGQDYLPPGARRYFIYLIAIGDNAKVEALRKIRELEKRLYDGDITTKVSIDMNHEGASMKSQMRKANKNGADIVLIIGENELVKNVVSIRDMKKNEQAEVPKDRLVGELIERIKRHATDAHMR